jgi:hypothetical protein
LRYHVDPEGRPVSVKVTVYVANVTVTAVNATETELEDPVTVNVDDGTEGLYPVFVVDTE